MFVSVALLFASQVSAPTVNWEGVSRTEVPATRLANYLMVEASVNGKPVKLIVDSGAGLNVLTVSAAKRLGLEGGQTVMTGGAGKESKPAMLVTLNSFKLGQADVKGDYAIVMDLPPVLGCDGLVGYSFLRHFVTTFDYDQNRFFFTDPSKFTPPPAAMVSELKIAGNHPQVKGKLSGEEGWFLLDSGNGGGPSIFPWFTEAHRLADAWKASAPRITGKGTGGFVTGRVAIGEPFTLAGMPVLAGPVSMPSDAVGAFAGKSNIANIGAETMRRFRISLDYPGKKAYFEKSAAYDAPARVDRSGARIDFEQGKFTVIAVLANSPAAEAGLAVGDEVRAINLVKAGEIHPMLFTASLMEASGTEIRLTFVRDGKEKEIAFKLRDLLLT